MKVLVANRGEIAIRIMRACQEMDIRTVAVYTDPDQIALHVRYADEAIPIGPIQGYLDIETIIKAARRSGADAIHPGYGFLSENAEFSHRVEAAGLTFIGPRAETITLMGDKLSARRTAREVGVPVLPGPDTPITEQLSPEMAKELDYPLLVKAAAGGGGRGIRLARNSSELQERIDAARKEAQAAFGDGSVYLEPMVQRARHIEIQIIGDGHGHVICLGERECSIQRRRQKLIEEAPAPGLKESLRNQIYEVALKLGRALNYRSLGTVEFLLDKDNNFHFIEVNPRIQVEHPVTEMVTRLDLVKEQLRLAMEGGLDYRQDQVEILGAAIEARILAEDASMDFMPATGTITHLKEPNGPGIRVDSALYHGYPVEANYDSLLSKVITWGENRLVAINRMRRALREYQIGGVATDLEFLQKIIDSPPFLAGHIDTTYLDRFKPKPQENQSVAEKEIAVATALFAHENRNINPIQTDEETTSWRETAWREQMRSL